MINFILVVEYFIIIQFNFFIFLRGQTHLIRIFIITQSRIIYGGLIQKNIFKLLLKMMHNIFYFQNRPKLISNQIGKL